MSDLTVIIPVRRMSGRLNVLSDAIVMALRDGLKVIVVHDWADESTEMELRDLEDKVRSNNFFLISEKFNSPGKARNAGVQITKTEWLAFWDADDLPCVTNLLTLMTLVKSSDSDIGIGAFSSVKFGENISPPEKRCPVDSFNEVASTPGIWRMIFRTKIVVDSPFEDFLLAEDQAFMSDIKIATRKVVFSDLVVYTYISRNPESLTGLNRKTEDLVRSIKHILSNIENSENKEQNEFDWIMVGLQTISLLKYGSLRNRIYALRVATKFHRKALRESKKIVLSRIVRNGKL